MAKSFYELDGIIEMNEKRLAEYTALYQKVFERLTNIILVYSALGIFLIPLTQHVMKADVRGVFFYVSFVAFWVLLIVSLVYFIRLLLPVDIAYLDPPKKYYSDYKTELELLNVGPENVVNDSLKGTYIQELEDAIEINSNAFRTKNSLFYNALIFALLASVPYIICVGWHISGGKS
ncbi:MAG TPA: hypothetical protein VNW04_05375 [Puia sp.]|jgi:hypothetical protein|nr:hypothetical protein [Puia sp.]